MVILESILAQCGKSGDEMRQCLIYAVLDVHLILIGDPNNDFSKRRT